MFLDMKNLFYTFPASPISNIITKIQVVFKNFLIKIFILKTKPVLNYLMHFLKLNTLV